MAKPPKKPKQPKKPAATEKKLLGIFFGKKKKGHGSK